MNVTAHDETVTASEVKHMDTLVWKGFTGRVFSIKPMGEVTLLTCSTSYGSFFTVPVANDGTVTRRVVEFS